MRFHYSEHQLPDNLIHHFALGFIKLVESDCSAFASNCCLSGRQTRNSSGCCELVMRNELKVKDREVYEAARVTKPKLGGKN